MHTSADSRSLAKCALIGRFAACYARLGKDWGPYRGSTIPIFGGVRTKEKRRLEHLPDQKRKNFEGDADNTHLCSPAPSFLLTLTVYVICPFLPAPLPAKCIGS